MSTTPVVNSEPSAVPEIKAKAEKKSASPQRDEQICGSPAGQKETEAQSAPPHDQKVEYKRVNCFGVGELEPPRAVLSPSAIDYADSPSLTTH